MTILTPDICIIGAGSAGLSVAAGAVQMGAQVVLIEKNKMGGDCLNTGCVPSKSLLAAAKTAKSIRDATKFGIHTNPSQIHFSEVLASVHDVINTIAPHDSVARFEKLGVKIILAPAKFITNDTVIAGDYQIKPKRFVIATGSKPSIPAIPGLTEIPYFTNETIFDLKEKPEHLIVVGGGPVGCELAQAFSLLGVKVTLLEIFTILPKDDPELTQIIRQKLLADGLALYENIKINSIAKQENNITIQFEKDSKAQIATGSHCLVATGRKADVAELDLAKAEVKFDRIIEVDKRLRTSNKKIFAIGDVIGVYQFTHTASYHASIVIKNILFKLPAKVDYSAMPWVTYTLPELAHVGLSETQAKQQNLSHRVLTWVVSENDRAQTERQTEGKIKIIVARKGKILGASIVAENAGDLLMPWILAINNGLKIKALAECIVPYPTLSEINKQVAGQYYLPFLTSERTKKIVRFLLKIS